jgi:prevent-host-death family protein
MRKVGSRELKNRLGRYLHAVRKGESLLVTDRGKAVAQISPVKTEPSEEASLDELLKQLESEGLIHLGKRPLRKFRRVKIKGAPASQTIIEDRQ